jgi:bacillithiol biosynthesis cysteine-adding enzyme BshC
MEIVDFFLPATNRFATEYYAQTVEIGQHFHYNYQKLSHYEERLRELAERSFLRNELADHIAEFMKTFPGSREVDASIAKLRQENCVAVIGGQQAGILTGPLYTIHKVISIIALAKEKEKELNVPVVPVFWIAGEDHDYLEVNHVYLPKELQLAKCNYPEKIHDKRMVTDCLINKDTCMAWVRDIIETFGETNHTNDLLSFAEKAISSSNTFVDFFAYLIMELFKEHGLLLVDSGDRNFRQMEKEIFLSLIKKSEEITDAVLRQQAVLKQCGFSNAIEISEHAANLFFYDEVNHERVLLEFDKGHRRFKGKNSSVSFSYDELMDLAREHPEKLSNNVVTRPVMQELLFPTLAFIAGPGEISYWSELKIVFEELGIKLPPIVPRINITLLERDIEADLDELEISLQEILLSGVTDKKSAFLESVKDKGFEAMFAAVKAQLKENYQSIEEKMKEVYGGLLPLLKKNEANLIKEVHFMEGKIEEALRIKHHQRLAKYDRVENSLRPSGSLQERTWNIFYFLNKYGLGFVDELTGLSYTFNGKHKVVKI